MKNVTKARLLSLLLALSLTLPLLAACADNGEDPAATGLNTSGEEGTEGITDSLPDDLDYGDREINILSRYREGWTNGEIAVEGQNGEPVNDAVFERNLAVESRLHVKLNSIEEHTDDQGAVIDKAALAVRTNSGDYDILAGACYRVLAESLNGTFANLRAGEYLDFTAPWWSQGFNEVIEYKGLQFAVTGSIGLSLYRFTFATLFNKGLFDKANVPYLYDVVKEGKWTLDYQTSLLPLFHSDDGNGKQDEGTDIFGLVSNDYLSVDPYWSSCKVQIIEKDENGDYQLVFDSDRLHGVAEKVLNMYYNSDGAMYDYPTNGNNLEQDQIRQMFSSGHAAMATMRLMELEIGDMRDMADPYGVVPMPKYDEVQDGYRTFMHDQFTVFSVLTTVQGPDLDLMTAVLECMGVEGERTIKPAYYETALRYKYMKDPESWDMMNILVDNIYIDAGIIYTNVLSTFHNSFRVIIGSKKNTVVSTYKSQTKACEKNLKQLAKKLDKLAG